jgi:hypothetical protein
MGHARRELKLADYVAIAISPVLIMTLVGSLVFFLLEVVYRGDHATRIQWVLICFVGGMVLVARIGIEQGVEQAQLYGGALLVVALLFASRFLDAFAIAAGLLCLIAFCAWKLTWDCTLVDDSEDASGEGLLRATGLDWDGPGSSSATTGENQHPHPGEPALRSLVTDSVAESTRPNLARDEFQGVRAPVPRVLVSGRGLAEEAERKAERAEQAEKRRQKQRGRPHAPGVWVVYFSLAALPLFGLGQLLIPASQGERRSFAFGLLVLYVASGLGLLLTTSFLGLRRYLRQRGVTMPTAVTRAWLFLGMLMAGLVLGGATLFPRPSGEYTLNDLIDRLDTQVDSSQFAILGGDAGAGPGGASAIRPVNGPDPNRQPDPQAQQGDPVGGARNKPVSPDQSGNEPGNQRGDQGGGEAGGQAPGARSGEAPGGEGQGAGESAGESSTSTDPAGNQSSQSSPPSGESNSGDKGSSAGEPSRPTSKDPASAEDSGQPPPGSDEENRGPPNTTDARQAGPREENRRGMPPRTPPPGQQGNPRGGATTRQQPPPSQDRSDADRGANPPREGAGVASSPPPPAAATPQTPGALSSAVSSLTQWLSSWGGPLKWIIYLVLALLGMYFLVRNAKAVTDFLARLWGAFLGLFGAAPGERGDQQVEEAAPGPRRYADFVNPFTDGTARRMKLPQLLDYTFQALEAWARDKGMTVSSGQTPLEFASRVAGRVPAIEAEVTRAGQLYTQVAYAKRIPPGDNLDVMEKLWRRLDDTRQG